MEKKELELYIHIPFCVKKCDYCDFLSFPADNRTQRRYVDALQKEITCYGALYPDRKITTIFIGGGTPSWLDEEEIVRILHTVREAFEVERDAEITIECNPGTATAHKLVRYREAGINRISIGLQSAHNEELALLGRIHTWEQFLKTYDLARKAGFSNINVDLMSALPGQTLETFSDTLKKVLALKPEHLSVYSLMIEEGTPFYERYREDEKHREAGEPTELLPDEEQEYAVTKLTQRVLREAGYHWYEVSNFAKPGYECRHNIGYWKRADYLGVGLGAASLIDNVRYANVRDLEEYCKECESLWEEFTELGGEKPDKVQMDSSKKNIQIERIEMQQKEKYSGKEDRKRFAESIRKTLCSSTEPVTREEQMEEFMFLGLRMTEGVSRAEFEQHFVTTIEAVYGDVLRQLQKEGLLVKQEGRICLTERGMDVNNYVVEQFML